MISINKIKNFILKRKVVSSIILIIVLIAVYFGWQAIFGNKQQVSYVTAQTTKDSIVSTVSGSGTVSASSDVVLKTKASSDVVAVKVKKGDNVKAGTVLVQLNAKDAAKAVRDAQAGLDSANLSLEKLKQPADELTLIQAENALTQAQQSKENAQTALTKAYEDTMNDLVSAYLDLPTAMDGLYEILYSSGLGKAELSIGDEQDNISALLSTVDPTDRAAFKVYENTAESDYQIAKAKYQTSYDNFKNTNRNTVDNSTVEQLLAQTIEATKAIAQSAKSVNSVLDVWTENRNKYNWTIYSTVATYQTELDGYTGDVNSNLATLLSIQQTLKTDKDAIANADRTIAEKTASLADLQAGTDALDLRAQEISVQQKRNALADAQEQYADYAVTAPFDGMVAAIDVEKGDTVASGANAVTLITTQQIANISLNEVDAAKVKAGQKVTITFDALSDLTMTGSVADVDMVGTVTSGVTSYNAKIVFDSQNDQIKPGMTANVNIIIDSKADALQVPSSAVKTSDSGSYVQVLVNGQPQKKEVTVGISSDTMTEIISGLNEGDEVITQTVTGNKTATGSSSSNSSSNRNSSNNNFRTGGPVMMGF